MVTPHIYFCSIAKIKRVNEKAEAENFAVLPDEIR